jgi:repressor LexA
MHCKYAINVVSYLYNGKEAQNMADVGNIISTQRKRLGLTMKEIAEAVGVSEATVSRRESGDINNMRRDKIAKLAAVLNLSPIKILGIEETPAPISDRELKFALYGDPAEDVSREDLKAIRDYAAYIRERKGKQ